MLALSLRVSTNIYKRRDNMNKSRMRRDFMNQ